MIDREQRHRRVEVLLLLVEVEVHSAKIHLQFGGVLFLLEQLLLGFRLLPGLALFELLLGLASLTFLLFVLLLLLVILLLLHLAADGLWSANVAEEVHHGFGDFLVLTTAIVGLCSSHILPEKLRIVVSVG